MGGNFAGNGDASHRPARAVASDAGDRQAPARDFPRRAAIQFPENYRVAESSFTFLPDEQVNFHGVFKAQRMLEIAIGVDPRPADRRLKTSGVNRKSERA